MEMTDLTTTRRPTTQTDAGKATTPAQASALITEQQVRFGSAAVALPRPRTRRWAHAADAIARGMRDFFAGPPAPARRHHPKRYGYIENALMAREMNRL
jgi:hypothetical protein